MRTVLLPAKISMEAQAPETVPTFVRIVTDTIYVPASEIPKELLTDDFEFMTGESDTVIHHTLRYEAKSGCLVETVVTVHDTTDDMDKTPEPPKSPAARRTIETMAV